MNLRAMFLAFVALLLIAPLASADQTSVPPAEALAASIFSAPASADCAEGELSWLAPSPRQAGLCGSCSQTICQGKRFGQFCKFQGGQYYYCQPAYIVCDPDDCQCWTGPLP